MSYTVPEKARQNFEKDGFAILPNVIDPETLAMLQMECGYFIGYTDAWMENKDIEVMGITHKGKRYFISNRYRKSPEMHRFLFGELMREITTSLLGPDAYLFVEQWVVKGAEQGMKFAWHQDSGYVKFIDPSNVHKPYLTCWCALDDMSPANGTISVLPHQVVGTRNNVLDHVREEGTNDLVGYQGDEPGVEINVPKGSVVVFSSTSLHRSSANTTDQRRRAYLAQYSSEPIYSSSGKLWSMAVPFVKDGNIVYDREKDLQSHEFERSRLREVLSERDAEAG
ncbi:MAG: phytanoyl-CoA dioxygenase family protein [Gammaproteobacteria bacterium]|nr:phytanoyl-CoA dioxygenase family protein [Gammaproteobacteria bacterium]